MELLQLHYFRTVAKLEHMTRAAEQLHIAQPALSKTISRLEEDLGVPLFDRRGRQIRLNSFGKAFLERVEAALNLLEEGRREVSEMAGLEQGSVHLTTSSLDLLAEPLSAFVARHPKVSFRITQASTEEMALLIEEGEADLGFTAVPIERPGFQSVTALSEEVYLAVPPGHRLADRKSVKLREVADEPFIGYKENFPYQRMNESFLHEAGISPPFVCRVDEPSAIARLVRAGLGVALIGGCNRSGSFPLPTLTIESPICQRHFRIVWDERRYLSLAARQFRDFIVQYFSGKEAEETDIEKTG